MIRLVFLALLSLVAYGAEPLLEPTQYNVSQWGTADGLPEEQIFGFAQTPDGFLWLATAIGLVRFDGKEFQAFHPEESGSATSSVVVAARSEGPSDLTVWARDGGILRFRDGRYEKLSRGNRFPFPLPNYVIVAKKQLWVAIDTGIMAELPGLNRMPKIPVPLPPGETVTAWTEDAVGKWFGTGKGRVLEAVAGKPARWITPPGLSPAAIVLRLVARGGKLAVGTTEGYYEFEGGTWRRFSNEAVTSLTVDVQGRIWTGTAVGLAVSEQGRFSRFQAAHGLPVSSVFATFLDSEGNIWASFERTGLFRISSPRFPAFGEPEGIVTDRILGLLDASSGLWISGEHAVDRLTADSRIRIALPPARRRVRSMLEDKANLVWISTSDDVLRVDPRTNAVTKIAADPALGGRHLLFQTREGAMWLAQARGFSLLKDGRFVAVPIRNFPVPLPLRIQMAQTGDGTLWLSARDRGLYRMERDELVSVLPSDPRMKKIHLMHADGNDLWLGLDGEGLARVRGGKLAVYPVIPQEGGGRVYGLAEDAAGDFWLGMRSGLAGVKKADVNRYLDGEIAFVPQKYFDSTDGLRSTNFGLSYTPVTSTRSRVVWMASLRGAIRIDSPRLGTDPIPPVVTLSHFTADNDRQLAVRDGVLEVPSDVETFRVLAEAPSLTAASKVRFRRKLEGYDRDWQPFAGGLSAYTKLPPGEYTLQVTASNGEGVWNEAGASLRIVKRPAIHQTWWFFVLVAAAAAAAIWLLIHWVTTLLRRRNEELEQHVQERTAELEKAKVAAEAAAQTKADFLATMSHEIRTPMHGMLGTLDLLSSTELDGDQREYVTTIGQSSNALLALLNDVLDLSKLEAGRMELRTAPFSLHAIAQQVARPFETTARLKQLAFEVSIDPRLPRFVIGDKPRIRQILFNLAGNALKFTDEGKVELLIEGEPADGGAWRIAFRVRDTGIGIAEEHFGSLFEMFHQVDASLRRRHGGTGLGLAICRRLADLMHGELTVESRVGIGSTFQLSVTLEEAAQAPAETLVESGAIPARFQGRILLAEDNMINRRMAQSLLEKLGCDVDTATNGLEALAKACEHTYDLVLMDCQMPEMDGIEATREIRSRFAPSTTPVIVAMTANAMEGDRERCLAAGMNDYLAKPFHLSDLIALLDRHLRPADSEPLETLGISAKAD